MGSLLLTLAACGGGDTPVAVEPAQRETPKAIADPSQGRWSPVINLSLVPAAAANLPSGKVLFWSAETRFSFSAGGSTYTSLFDPVTRTAAETLVSNTGHNMFCPGTTNLPDGRLLVNGGIDAANTSLYNPTTNAWSSAAPMNIARGYHANCLLQDGSVFTLGGSWSGGVGGKHGEVWNEAQGWRRLTGVPVTSMLSVPANSNNSSYDVDSHFWLIPAGNGKVLYAGPGFNMQWIDTRGNGSVMPAGARGDDQFSVNGNAVLYDIGKVLKTGGGPAYEDVNANANSYVIDINAGASVRKIAPTVYPRAYHNSVVLPNGQVMLVGGMTFAKNFTDTTAVLRPELFDPVSESFTLLPPMDVARTYHSVALLLPDARVLSAGGGLCGAGCPANHPDLQIYTPHYLFNADGTDAVRPAISGAPTQAVHGTRIGVTTDAAIASFALVRMSSVTHAVNNDQRRVPVAFTATGANAYDLTIPSNPGVVLPGYYMLFAINADGVPSVARTLQITGSGAPTINNPDDQTSDLGAAVSLPASASGATSYAASGLPPGLSINAATGAITGTATQAGRYAVTLVAINATAQTSTHFVWKVGTPTVTARWFRLEALSEVSGQPVASMAEFNLLDQNGAVINRSGWTASADSADAAGAASNAIDGSAATRWQTAPAAPMPHAWTVDTGASRQVSGFRYLPRNDGSTLGTIAGWRLLVSNDGSSWTVVASGNFVNLGGPTTEKTVLLATASAANGSPTLSPVADQTRNVGQAVSLPLNASDPDGDTLSYSATGLPPGLSIDPVLGVITGAPSVAGVYAVSVQVTDGRGGVANAAFTWTVIATAFAIDPVPAAAVAEGGSVSYTVGSNGGAGVTYTWNFGDGTPTTAPSSATTIGHTFAVAGLYTVSVSATQPGGAVTTRTFVQAVTTAVSGSARPTQSSSLAVQPVAGGNPRVWLVNQDNDSVSVFDAITAVKLGETAVGAAPRSVAVAPDGRIWVVNKGTATVSIVDRTSLAVVQTVALPRASMPFGLAFAPDGSAGYVALEGTGQLLKLHPTSGAVLASVAVGPNPRQLSVTAASERILVSRFISLPLPGESTAAVATDVGGAPRGGEVVVVTSAMSVERTVVLQHSDRTDTSLQGAGVPNYLAAAVIAPDGRSAWVTSKQDNVRRGVLRSGLDLDFQNSVRAITSRIDLTTWLEDGAARVDHDNSGLGSAAVFHPSGAYLFVALQTSRQVAVMDAVGKRELFRFDVGRAPDALAISADGLRLYVNNFMDRTLGVHDLSRLTNYGELVVTAVAVPNAVASERLAANVLQGKRLFYDARDTRLARDAYLSCASCHNDGGQDGRVWDMTGFGEGLRNTISLRGRGSGSGHGRAHWTGNFDEIQDFEAQIRTLAGGSGLMSNSDFNAGTRSQPLGDPKTGLSADLDALAAYVASLNAFAPSPQRPSPTAVSSAALEGRLVFSRHNCASCHAGAPYTNSVTNVLVNVGTIKPASGKRLGATLLGLDVPTLRDVWATAPYLHDGSAATLEDAVKAHAGLGIGEADAARVAAYLKEIGSEEGPAPQFGSLGTIWPAGAAPLQVDDGDSASTNVGTRFRSDLSGYITAIRFYKAPANTGTHIGALWTAAGQQLASVTFTNETASGWQQANLAAPVPVAANAVYVVSYVAPNGHYTGEDDYFATGGVDNPPLHALRDGESGANGLYQYATGLAFPTQTYRSENYWVDVVFTNSIADNTPPTVSATTPLAGATAVPLAGSVSATFSEAMDAATVSASTFELRTTATSSLVTGSVAYNAATRVATFTAATALAPGTAYSASVRGGSTDPRAKDSAGNALASTVSWSFTTAVPDTTAPTISARSPADGAGGLALTSTVTLSFNENMDAASVNNTTFLLRTAGGASVPAGVNYNAATRVATLTPSSALLPSTTYIATARGGGTDPRLKDVAGNALAATAEWTFATVVADTVAPTISAATPSGGATGVATSTSVVVTFNEPMDAGSISPASIELRQTTSGAVIASNVSYAVATQTATLSPTAALTPGTTYTVTVRGGADTPQARDSAGNALAATASWSFTTATGPSCPCTIWLASATPAVAAATDAGSVNLGVKFRSDIAGFITGVRFYKGSGNTGTHVGSLWSNSGQLLAQATFVNETVSGWQQVNFSAPVAVAADTTYVASYLAPVGRYAIDSNYFAATGADNAPLHALSTSAGAGNGVYAYGGSPAFPNATFNASNYWVDVVFATSAVDNTAPTVSARSPAAGATGVSVLSAVNVTFSEPVEAASVSASTFVLRDAQGAIVGGAVGYNASTQVATFTPSSALAPSTQYTATVRGGATDPVVRDLAGNRLATDSVGSFTTAAADTTPPTVTATTPANAATGISRSANITVTFSEAMNASTVNPSTIELRAPGGAVVASAVSYSATNRRATLNPNPTLTGLTTYTVVVRGGATDPRVKDAAGNPLAVDRVWNFTTRQ